MIENPSGTHCHTSLQQGPFLVDEKGFGKFHIINLGSPKQQGAGDENKPNVSTHTIQITVFSPIPPSI